MSRLEVQWDQTRKMKCEFCGKGVFDSSGITYNVGVVTINAIPTSCHPHCIPCRVCKTTFEGTFPFLFHDGIAHVDCQEGRDIFAIRQLDDQIKEACDSGHWDKVAQLSKLRFGKDISTPSKKKQTQKRKQSFLSCCEVFSMFSFLQKPVFCLNKKKVNLLFLFIGLDFLLNEKVYLFLKKKMNRIPFENTGLLFFKAYDCKEFVDENAAQELICPICLCVCKETTRLPCMHIFLLYMH